MKKVLTHSERMRKGWKTRKRNEAKKGVGAKKVSPKPDAQQEKREMARNILNTAKLLIVGVLDEVVDETCRRLELQPQDTPKARGKRKSFKRVASPGKKLNKGIKQLVLKLLMKKSKDRNQITASASKRGFAAGSCNTTLADLMKSKLISKEARRGGKFFLTNLGRAKLGLNSTSAQAQASGITSAPNQSTAVFVDPAVEEILAATTAPAAASATV